MVERNVLLTREQEIEYGRAVQAGLKAKIELDRLQQNHLDPEKAAELEGIIDLGREARNSFVEANLRLVPFFLPMIIPKEQIQEDLIQEGNLGLIRAVEKFDPELGFRFTTYAYWWIRQAVWLASGSKERIIRLPPYAEAINQGLESTREQLTGNLGREPTPAELACELGIAAPILASIIHTATVLSLDHQIQKANGKEDTAFGYLVKDPNPGPDKIAAKNILRGYLSQIMENGLTPRERKVLELRFGWNGDREHTLEETGQIVGVTRERARQIEAKALGKLRHNKETRHLAGFLDD